LFSLCNIFRIVVLLLAMRVAEIIFLLHKICVRSSNNFFTVSVFRPSLLFKIIVNPIRSATLNNCL
jgi:hypothetical protein